VRLFLLGLLVLCSLLQVLMDIWVKNPYQHPLETPIQLEPLYASTPFFRFLSMSDLGREN
jgi:hypothetical protein